MPGLKAVILVGGPSRGTRFRPLSLSMPKPLFPIAGYPMIYHHVHALASLPDMKEILIIGFYEPQLFEKFIHEAESEFPQVVIRYLREYQSLGTGGGLYHFRDQILRGQPEQFFVIHADVCCAVPLKEMLTFHRQQKKDICTLLGTKVPKETATRYGCLVKDDHDQILHYTEKPETFVSDLISCGVYLFQPEIFEEMKSAVLKHGEKEADSGYNPDRVRLEQDILRPMAGTNRLYVYETTGFWRQIKTAGSVLLANKLYLKNYNKIAPKRLAQLTASAASSDALNKQRGPFIVGDVYIHPEATVHPTARIGPNVSIGPRTVIGPGVRIRDSILLDNVEIKNNSCILHSVLASHTKVGSWCRIEGTPEYATENISPAANISELGNNVWTKPITDLMLEGGMKNQSATVFGESVKVSDEVAIRNCVVLPHKELKNSFKNEILM